jgi:hypothetical protein
MDPRHAAFATKQALKAQVAAAEHMRDCARCSHLFQIAYQETVSGDVVLDLSGKTAVSNPFDPFFVTSQIVRELRSCPNWPKSI